MRRAFEVWQDGFGNFHPKKVPDATRYFIDVPKKQPLIDGLNSLNMTEHFTFVRTALTSTFPGFDNAGNPVDYPGTVVSPGDPVAVNYFTALQFAFQVLTLSTNYHSKNNGDGDGAIITPTSRSSTLKTGGTAGSGDSGGTIELSALVYLNMLLEVWILGTTSQGRRLGGVLVPQRWIETLIATIDLLKQGKITPEKALAIIAALT